MSQMAISPPLVITETQVDELFDKLEQALNETLDWDGPRKHLGGALHDL